MTTLLALYPNARGLCYACIQMPSNLIDYGVANPLPFSKARFIKRVEKFIEFYQPKIVVLRGIEKDTWKNMQSGQLIEGITQLANERGLSVHSYTRKQIRDVFDVHEAKTKHEISQKLISWIPDLAPLAPQPRKLWMPEDHRMGIFDAVALAVTHDYLCE